VKKAKKAPTIKQVAKACKITVQTARRYLYYLQKAKKIKKSDWSTGVKKKAVKKKAVKKKTVKRKAKKKTVKKKENSETKAG